MSTLLPKFVDRLSFSLLFRESWRIFLKSKMVTLIFLRHLDAENNEGYLRLHGPLSENRDGETVGGDPDARNDAQADALNGERIARLVTLPSAKKRYLNTSVLLEKNSL